MFSFYFKKLMKTIPTYFLKIILYFTLFLKIVSDQTVLENFKNDFRFFKT